MTNQQLYLAIGIPILFNTSFIFLLFMIASSRSDRIESKVDRLDNKVDTTRLELVGRIDRVADATAVFYRELDRHSNAIDKLEKN